MHERCENPKSIAYNCYGGRGISICEDWALYSKFCAWAWNNGYSDELSLGRNNVNGNYNPQNCRWTTIKELANNKRSNKYIEYNGELLTLTEWSAITSVDKRNISKRIARGWKDEEAIGVKPHNKEKKINIRKRNNKWEYRIEVERINGKRHQITKCGFLSKEEAINAANEYIENHAHAL